MSNVITRFDEEKFLQIRIAENQFVKNDAYHYLVAINNLQRANFPREFVAKPYVIIHYEGEGGSEIVYPTGEEINIRSAAQSAQNIIDDPEMWNKYNATQKKIIQDYLKFE